DVARRPPDPRVEPRDLTLLVRQTTLDHLEIGEHGGLPCARVGGLLLFLSKLSLRLLQSLLLGRDGVLTAFWPGLRARRARDDAGDEAEGQRGARAHGSVRPRARQ